MPANALINFDGHNFIMLLVAIYADEKCHHKIKTFNSNELFADSGDDFLDGTDWWNPILVEIEAEFGAQWCHAFIATVHSSQGRMFSRSCKDSGGHDFVPDIQPIGIVFSRLAQETLLVSFKGEGYKTFDLSHFDFSCAYVEGSSERIVQQLSSVFDCVQRRFLLALVLVNPTPFELNEIRNLQDTACVFLTSHQHYVDFSLYELRLNKLFQMVVAVKELASQMKSWELEDHKLAVTLTATLEQALKSEFGKFETLYGLDQVSFKATARLNTK
jgi:hypothetical protein